MSKNYSFKISETPLVPQNRETITQEMCRNICKNSQTCYGVSYGALGQNPHHCVLHQITNYPKSNDGHNCFVKDLQNGETRKI